MRAAGIAALIALGTGLAVADDGAARVAAVKALLEAQTKALLVDDGGAAYQKTLVKDAYDDLQEDLMGPEKIAIGQTKIGWAGTCGWLAAEVPFTNQPHPEGMTPGVTPKIPPRMRHWVALVVPDGAAVETKAHTVLVTTPDKDLENGKYNYVRDLPAETSPTPLVAWLAQPAVAAKSLAADPAVTVFGTSAADHAFGPSAAKKLLTSWGNLKLDVVNAGKGDHDSRYDHGEVVAGDCAAAHAMVRMKIKDGAILLHGFAVAHKAGDHWELVALVYGPDRAY